MTRKPMPSKVLIFGPEPEEQARKQQIEKWCRSRLTYPQIAALCLSTYNLQVGRSQLSRFFDEINTERAEKDINEAASVARARVQVTKDAGVSFGAALEAEFAQDLYQLKLAGASDEVLDAATERYVKVAKANQARKDSELELTKFQFNAARAALKHAAELKQIAGDSTLDEEARVDAARRRLFGENAPS